MDLDQIDIDEVNKDVKEDKIYTTYDVYKSTNILLSIISTVSIALIIPFSTNKPISSILCFILGSIALYSAMNIGKGKDKFFKIFENILGPLRLVTIFILMVVSGKEAPTWLMYIPAIGIITFTINDLKKRRGALTITMIAVILGNYLSGKDYVENLVTSTALFFFMIFLVQTVNFLSQISKKLAVQRRIIINEREKSEKLLLNTLPLPIVKRMKAGETRIADQFDSIVVLFADIVGFTKLSETITASEVVELLDTVFSEFDKVTEEFGLEKIKTIGDAYMVVGGMPEPNPDHMEAMAHLSLKFHEAVSKLSFPFCGEIKLRVGIHTGEVVAGIIGQRKFAYDLWGDTVNVASRMESHGIPGETHCSEDVYVELKNKFAFEERGVIEVKGKGEMKTYFLTGEI